MAVDAGDFLIQTLRSEQTLENLRRWYSASPPVPLKLDRPMPADLAEALGSVVRSLPNWKLVRSVLEQDQNVRPVSESEWLSAEPGSRWSSQQIAEAKPLLMQQILLEDHHRITIARFFLYFVVGTKFRSWISAITGVPIAKEVTCEFAHYRPGDFIVEHADRHDERIIGVNIYLGPWSGGSGGRLGYRCDDGPPSYVEPTENSISLFRVLDGCKHWVEPWVGDRPGRYTISLSYRPMK